MAEKETYEKLSNLREQALRIIEEYNKLATEENVKTRIGVMSSEFIVRDEEDEEDEGEDDEKETNYDKLVQWCEKEDLYLSCDMPGAYDAWNPSGLNC